MSAGARDMLNNMRYGIKEVVENEMAYGPKDNGMLIKSKYSKGMNNKSVGVTYFEALLPDPEFITRDLGGIPNFDTLSRAELLKINPRYRTREAQNGVYLEHERSSWKDVIPDGTDETNIWDLDDLVDQVLRYRKLLLNEENTYNLSPKYEVALEDLALDYIAGNRDDTNLFADIYRTRYPNFKKTLDRIARVVGAEKYAGKPELVSSVRGSTA